MITINDSELEWMLQANCKDMDTRLWFPELGAQYSEFAMEVCDTCPVSTECMWYANEIHAEHGMFGGLTPNQRLAWRRKAGVSLGERRPS